MDVSGEDDGRRVCVDSSDIENRPSLYGSSEVDEETKDHGNRGGVLRARTNNDDDDDVDDHDQAGNHKRKDRRKRLRDQTTRIAKTNNSRGKEKGRRDSSDKKQHPQNVRGNSSPKDFKRRDEDKELSADLTEENDLTTDKDLDLESQASWKRRRSGKGRKRTPRTHRSSHRYHHHSSTSKTKHNISQTSILRRADISDGKDKMVWARRAFLMSTEKIFPGFIRQYEATISRARDPTGVKLRTSVSLKMCLLAHAYFLPFWFIAFLITQEFAAKSLKPLHNYVHTCLTYVSVGTDVLRLYAGFASNDRDDMQLMALYWMATAILQTPMMCFIFATHCFSTLLLSLNVAVDVLLGAILILEIWMGFWQLKRLVSSEINLLYMARRMNTMSTLKSRERRYHPRVINAPDREPYVAWTDTGSSTYTTSSSEVEEIDAGKSSRGRSGLGDLRDKSARRNRQANAELSAVTGEEISATE